MSLAVRPAAAGVDIASKGDVYIRRITNVLNYPTPADGVTAGAPGGRQPLPAALPCGPANAIGSLPEVVVSY